MMRAALIIGLSLATFPVKAEGIDGKTLIKWCTSAPETLGAASCTLYVTGFVNGAEDVLLGTPSNTFCLPKHFTGAEGIAVFLRIMRNDMIATAVGNQQPDLAIATAFGVAFPCKPSN